MLEWSLDWGIYKTMRKWGAIMKALLTLPNRLEGFERRLAVKCFDDSAGLLANGVHLERVRGAMDLAELAQQDPVVLHVKIMRLFVAFLVYPPCYGAEHQKAGKIDPYSDETIAIMRAIVSRTPEQIQVEKDAGYSFSLSPNSPFTYQDGSFYFEGQHLEGNTPPHLVKTFAHKM